jgi:Cellulase (glycosyl hydrolase family 5)
MRYRKRVRENLGGPVRKFVLLFLFTVEVVFMVSSAPSNAGEAPHRWSEEKANQWYQSQGWLVGSNYNPASAINQLEMWQAETYDAKQIDKELGWAENLGMKTMRVYLHDLLWTHDQEGFKKRIDNFLTLCEKHRIKPMFVIFDSCWDPNPALGPQHPPIPGVHNSGWVQSPGAKSLLDANDYPRLQAYVEGLIGSFANDQRILAWDVWNEPNNGNAESYGKIELKNKEDLVAKLLPQVFDWARAAQPTQPLTSGVWDGDWSSPATLTAIQRTQLQESDIISFHNYGWPEDFEQAMKNLQRYHRPLICTEYMARGSGSTFDTILPLAKQHNVSAINWGLVAGKSQTNLPWDSWQKPYVLRPPTIWFHEVFHGDGKPYREREAEIIRNLTGRVSP